MKSETYKPGMIAVGNKFDNGKHATQWDYQANVFRGFIYRALPLYSALSESRGDPTLEVWADLKSLARDFSALCQLTFAESDRRALPSRMIPGRGDWTEWTVHHDDREPMKYMDFCSSAYDLAQEVFDCSILYARLSDMQRAVSFVEAIMCIETEPMQDGEHA